MEYCRGDITCAEHAIEGTKLCVIHTPKVDIPAESLARVKIASKNDRVYKDECGFSFDTPTCPTGLYLNLTTFQSRGEKYLEKDYQATKAPIYLHSKWTKQPKEKKQTTASAEGSTVVDLGPDWEWKKTYQIVLMPGKTFIPFHDQLPPKLVQAVKAVLDNVEPVDESSFDFKGEVSKYALDLVQLNNGKKISPNPKDWKCEASGETQNLWLNLSTGYIGGGRKTFDGSGGSGAALAHYEEQLAKTGQQFPLVVKLGTIGPHGGDVFSYAPDENDTVQDPYLAQHLAHWGIDIMQQTKTEKSMAELAKDLSMQLQFDRIQESGENLKKVSGPNLVGIDNIGNSCYINSMVQMFFATPEFRNRYLDPKIFEKAPANPITDLGVQLAKMAIGLCTDTYVAPKEGKHEDEDNYRITAKMLKSVVAENHPDFKTGQQQDVFQYFQHFLSILERNEKRSGGGNDLVKLFSFAYEERLECEVSKRVAYRVQPGQNVMLLPVPLEEKKGLETPMETETAKSDNPETPTDSSSNENAPAKKAKLTEPEFEVSFDKCLEQFASPQHLTDFRSPATGQKGPANKLTRFHSFPKYLVMQVQRFTLGADWIPRKVNVRVKMPLDLDLEHLRSQGLQPDETEMKTAAENGTPAATVPNPEIMTQLMSMGVASENGCKRACVATKNAGVEVAMDWVFAHMEDADFNLPLPGLTSGKPEVVYPEEIVAMLASMGFSSERVVKALQATGGNPDRAGEWLFSHGDEPEATTPSSVSTSVQEGNSKYELMGFISHIGPNTKSGHYIAHIKKNDKWYIFDDSKVAESKSTPFEWGYLYFYKQK